LALKLYGRTRLMEGFEENVVKLNGLGCLEVQLISTRVTPNPREIHDSTNYQDCISNKGVYSHSQFSSAHIESVHELYRRTRLTQESIVSCEKLRSTSTK